MLSSEASCSDCRIEFIQKKWSQLLLKWINKCVHDGHQPQEFCLRPILLSDVLTKYKDDVCATDIDKAMTFSDDIEPFIKYKYPILRLRYLSEEEDLPQKLYIMASILLFHCCTNSSQGVVHEDICKNFSKYEQEMVLWFCEKLADMECTVHNVMLAVEEAFNYVDKNRGEKSSSESSFGMFPALKSTDTEAVMSSVSTLKLSYSTLTSDATLINAQDVHKKSSAKMPPMKFASSLTILPSVVTDTSIYSSDIVIDSDEGMADQGMYVDSDQIDTYSATPKYDRESNKNISDSSDKKARSDKNTTKEVRKREKEDNSRKEREKDNMTINKKEKVADLQNKESNLDTLDSDCACTRTSANGPCCGEPASTTPHADPQLPSKSSNLSRIRWNRKLTAFVIALTMFVVLVVLFSTIVAFFRRDQKEPKKMYLRVENIMDSGRRSRLQNGWRCKNSLCQKVYRPTNEEIYPSHSRCTLLCSGPQLWPHPIGHTQFSSKVIALATNKLEYKLKTVASESLERYLAEALKLFIGDLAKLEKTGDKHKTRTLDIDVKKMNIQIEVESDTDPRMRLNTEEAYRLRLETIENQVIIKVTSSSFCGVRHGLETLTQMILLDESTGYLITVANADVKDAPSYKYRGLMIDTGRNYIPVQDLLKTIDGMATVKLNTFHWRVSDVTSFPLSLPKLPLLVEYGAFDRSMVYTKEDVSTIVKRAGVRGIRVLIEVALPGPVGRPWSWSPITSCSSKNGSTCDNVLCSVLNIQDSVTSILQDLYEEILEMTQVDDVFHLSNGLFSLANCYNLLSSRDGFLDKALNSLKLANKGFLPKMPIIWYTEYLTKPLEAKVWERYGVQLSQWKQLPSEVLNKFRVIHSSKWELSCEMRKQQCRKYRSWQELYSWKSWRNLEAFTVEGGEATLWTDIVNSGNLEYHLWPRLTAVAERLWSDIIANGTADGSVYVRLNNHRSRLLQAGISVQPIWPAWCTANPEACLEKVKPRKAQLHMGCVRKQVIPLG